MLEIFKVLKNSWQTIIFTSSQVILWTFEGNHLFSKLFVVFRFYFLLVLFHIVSKAGIFFFNSAGSVGYRCFFFFTRNKKIKKSMTSQVQISMETIFASWLLGKIWILFSFLRSVSLSVILSEIKNDWQWRRKSCPFLGEWDHTCFRGKRPALNWNSRRKKQLTFYSQQNNIQLFKNAVNLSFLFISLGTTLHNDKKNK